jgi:membrane protease YdiL (CAAX protease family)
MFHWRVGAQWYVFAASYMAVIKLAVAVVYRLDIGSWPRLGNEPWYVIAVAIALSAPMQAGEEIGWRGYALPHLAARFGLAKASLMLGLIGACWHLPLFFIPGIDKYGQSFPLWTLQVMALYVAASWLYWHTNGSLLLVMLLHSAVNQSLGIIPSAVPGATSPFALKASLVGWLTLAFLWGPAVYFLIRMRRAKLSLI